MVRKKEDDLDLIRTIRNSRLYMKTELIINLKEGGASMYEIASLIRLFDQETDKLIAEGTTSND